MQFSRIVAVVALLLTIHDFTRAEPPATELPAPRPAPAQVVPAPEPVFLVPKRVSAYAVWDLYAPDRQGRFKPRVFSTPYGAFYPLTGQPYPWVPTNARAIMPYAID
jgi:hypothetical protein